MNTYTVLFYSSEQGNRPIEKFLDRCQNGQRIKILRQIQYLQEFGLTKLNPSLRKILGTPLWETRVLGKDNIRLICCNHRNGIVLLHIFFKKKQTTPLKEIATALSRFNDLSIS